MCDSLKVQVCVLINLCQLMQARINKDRLQLLLDEVQNKNTSEDRYRASLKCASCGKPYVLLSFSNATLVEK